MSCHEARTVGGGGPRPIVARALIRALRRHLLAPAAMLLSTVAAFAQPIDENLWAANGVVRSVVRDGGTICIGGDLTRVGPAAGTRYGYRLCVGDGRRLVPGVYVLRLSYGTRALTARAVRLRADAGLRRVYC